MAAEESTTSGLAPTSGRPLTQRHKNLLEDYFAIEQEDARRAGTVGYMARILAQATLPHVDPKLPTGMMYSRTTGLATLNVVPTTRKYGVPFGSIPRIALAWLCTEAVRTKEKQLSLGRSQAEFLDKLQLHNNGRDIARMKEQCMRLFRSIITIEYENDNEESSHRLPITSNDTVLWHKNPDVQSLWVSTITLTDEFFREVTASPVPVDLRVFHSLSKSPLAMDIYTWLTYRMYVMRRTNRPFVTIPWAALRAQLGADYADTPEGMRNFRKKFRARLHEVLLFYPAAAGHVTDTGTSLRLTPAPLHMPGLHLR